MRTIEIVGGELVAVLMLCDRPSIAPRQARFTATASRR
jgi:hypothetical protein